MTRSYKQVRNNIKSKQVMIEAASSISTAVKHLLRHSKVKGLSPADAADTRRENLSRKK